MFLLVFVPKSSLALEALGGEITWKCAGGNNFVFELVLYRDCNSLDITSVTENIKVWNHISVTDIAVNFVSKSTISPTCTQNNGSLSQLDCGSGDNGGNGLGAVQKFIYQSSAISLNGIPPPEAWIFTYTTSSRKASISNINNPALSGMTLVAKMFKITEVQNFCLDNSPQFLENPYLVVCTGTDYFYMPNVSDSDLDSLSFKLVNPLNNFSAGSFNPPTNPIQTSFSNGFSANSPTPGIIINGTNSSFQMNPLNGDMSFNSPIAGEYLFKFLVESYRNGRKIAEVEREILVFVVDCNETNSAPTILAPIELSGTFEGTFTAGSLVNLTLNSSDLEFLQDGFTPQENTATITGKSIATLTNTDVQGSSINFSWQTDCLNLKNAFGNDYASVPYDFVIKVQDNYCQIPKVSYQRIRINLTTTISAETSQIQCVKTLANGDLDITWSQVSDPNNDFLAYELYSLQNGLLGTYPAITSTNQVISAVFLEHDFYVKTISGSPCSIAVSSDTVSNIQLALFNPADGTVSLTWNQPVPQNTVEISDFYEVYREFPAGTWTFLGSTNFGVNQFRDTVDICSAFLNYKVVLQTSTCSYVSNILGDNLEDKISPNIPLIANISVDTLTGLTTLSWNQNPQVDTYGYIIYMNPQGGILTELDTVFGVGSTSYTFQSTANLGPLTFSVAAFDSCNTDLIPVTYQTSAKGDIHTTMFLTSEYDICSKTISLDWTKYIGFETIDEYEILGRKLGETWQSFGTTSKRFFDIELEEYLTYEFVVQAKDSLSTNTSFSNKITFYTVSSSLPKFNYTRVATVTDNLVEIKHYVEAVKGISELALERKNEKGIYEEIERLPMAQNITFTDENVIISEKSYEYQVRIIDSCGNPSKTANEVKTILLQVQSDNIKQSNYLFWNAYKGFNGSILGYNVYRIINGVFESTPFHFATPNELFFEDTSSVVAEYFDGKICYLVTAVEGDNIYGFRETSYSNEVCPVFEPIVYIPTSFTPNGDEFNQEFKPVVSRIDVFDYNFTVIDRWGQIVFRTSDLDEAWDGTINSSDKLAPSGTYIYVVQLKDGGQQEIIRRGHVTLFR